MSSNTNMNNLTKTGVKGSDVYTSDGVGDARVALNTLLVRGVTQTVIDEHLNSIWQQAVDGDNQALEDMWVLLFQNRDVRGGKGERASSELMWQWMNRRCPQLTLHMLQLVPEYGCWRDLFKLAEHTGINTPLYDHVVQMAVDQIRKDAVAADAKDKVSLLAKWIPREGRQDRLAKDIARKLFPEVTSPSVRMMSYRKMIVPINAHLKTVETMMCADHFEDITPAHVPGRALKKYIKAYLNEPCPKKDGRVEHGALRHPDHAGRMACREHFQTFFQQAKEGKVVAKAKDVVFPHELVQKIANSGYGGMSEDERNGVIAQWMGLVKAARDAGGLGRSLAMCDFSGSMQTSGSNGASPYWVSMAMGLLISEITTDEFKDSFLTFDSNPILYRLAAGSDIVTRVNELNHSGAGQGTSTDFQKAMDLVLSNLKANRVRPGQEPENLIVITDMGWDQACGSSETSYYTGHSYRHVVKTKPWQTHIQMIREAFKRAGEDMWGVPFVPPRIVIWNVAATVGDFHATKDEEGVVMVSGWSPSLFKNLLKGDIRSMTPMEMLRIQLDDDRYDLVRQTYNQWRADHHVLGVREEGFLFRF
jgi:hypothetical protein